MPGFDIQDIEFRNIDGHSLHGRLYRPRGVAEAPLLVDIHGGAWTKGDRFNNKVINESLAEDGIAVFAVDFRMPPLAKYPETFADVNAAIRWTKAHARELGSRPELVGGLGTSSGGHLLMLNALRPNDPLYADTSAGDARLDYVVVCWPILDPLARYAMARELKREQLLLAHHTFWPDEKTMELANPQLIVDRGDFEHLPAVLLIQGTNDANVEHFRADAFGESYRAAGGSIDVQKYKDEVHMFLNAAMDSPASVHAMAAMKQFVKAQTQGK
jgi:acetyl esterase/lipase